MKSRPTQFGVCENTASSRQPGSRLAVNSSSPQLPRQLELLQMEVRASSSGVSNVEVFDLPLTEANRATAEEMENSSQTYVVTPQTKVAEPYVGAVEAAKFLSIHPRTLAQMARQGDVPAHPLSNGQRRVWRFLLSELDVWMRERIHSRCRPCSPRRREISR